MDRPVAERRCKRFVDEPVLVDEREPVEAARRDGHLEMVAPARSVDHRQLVGGADIVEELYESGALQTKLDEALGADRETGEKTTAVA